MVKELKTVFKNNKTGIFKINLDTFGCMFNLRECWESIPAKQVRNCWRRANLLSVNQLEILKDLDEQQKALPTNDNLTRVKEGNKVALAFSHFLSNEFNILEDIEKDLTAINEAVPEHMIIQHALTGATTEEINDMDMEIEEEEVQLIAPIVTRDVVLQAQGLLRYLQRSNRDLTCQLALVKLVPELEDEYKNYMVQTDISKILEQ